MELSNGHDGTVEETDGKKDLDVRDTRQTVDWNRSVGRPTGQPLGLLASLIVTASRPPY